MSKRTSAHVTTVHRVDMTKVAKMRERHKARFPGALRLRRSPTCRSSRAPRWRRCAQYPLLNASIDGNNIIYHNEINIGIAVALENGLIVPVIRNADEKNVLGLQRSIVDLAARARSRQLKPDEVQGGTFSITNFGSFGSVFATPVINQPQVAILGVGAVEKTPVVIDDAIAIRSHLPSRAHLRSSPDRRRAGRSVHDEGEAGAGELVGRSAVMLRDRPSPDGSRLIMPVGRRTTQTDRLSHCANLKASALRPCHSHRRSGCLPHRIAHRPASAGAAQRCRDPRGGADHSPARAGQRPLQHHRARRTAEGDRPAPDSHAAPRLRNPLRHGRQSHLGSHRQSRLRGASIAYRRSRTRNRWSPAKTPDAPTRSCVPIRGGGAPWRRAAYAT